jgi:23S rRNA pseudouridine1911/1915/1917 synthase
MEPIVVYEEEEFAVINKPAGLIVHAAHNEPSVVSWLVRRYPECGTVGDDSAERPGIVHRLDKETSGVMLVCRTQAAFEHFKKAFQEKKVRKTYLAVVYGAPKERAGIIDKPIGISANGSLRRTTFVSRAKKIQSAVTRYAVLKTIEKNGITLSLVRAEPVTGRTHQIRVHLAALGCPIAGDKMYGPKKQAIALPRHALHADTIECITRAGAPIAVAADMPRDMAALLE